MEMIEWLENWYSNNCDGDWEHDYGIKIFTLDNPGWVIKIDFNETGLKLPNEEWKSFKNSENDWYEYQVVDNTFNAAGDTRKLSFLIGLFRSKVNG